MPIYTVQGPDGRTYKIEGPAGATAEQLGQFIMASSRKNEPAYDPTEGMSTTERFLAGAGKAMVDLGRGAGQLVGLVSNEDVAESRKRDAALMNTGAGKAGNFFGNVAAAIPSVLVPGAATVPGAAAIGAVQGLLQPSVSTDEAVQNTMLGGAAGAGGIMLGRAIAGGYQGAKALVEPFTESGRDKIAGRVIQRFAQDPAKVAQATGGRSATGALPTLAEETGDAGIARLQDALRSVDPQIGSAIGQRAADNNAARVAALQSLAGDSQKMAAALAAREAQAAPLYGEAFAKTVQVDDALNAILSRPSVQKALARAQSIAAEEGRKFGMSAAKAGASGVQLVDDAGRVVAEIGGTKATPSKITGQTLQDLKMGMDALLKDPTAGIAGKEAANVRATRDALVSWMEKSIPEFKAARTGYAANSRPINAMQVGEEIARRATSNTSDLAGNPRMQANALLGMLRDEQALIERATGRKGVGKALSDVFTPDELAMLQSVAKETDRAAAVASAGAGPGSATAQRMASQNILRQLVGPTGLPESWADSVVANTIIGKPLNLVYGGVAEPKIQQALADAVLNPQSANRLIQAAQPRQAIPDNALIRLLQQSARVTPSTLAVTGER